VNFDNVQVYLNITTGAWSVRKNGLVLGHTEYILIKPTKFHVGESGNRRIRCYGESKNVHAWIVGDIIQLDTPRRNSGVEISYNPVLGPFFCEAKTGIEVFASDFKRVYMNSKTRKMYGLKG
jgi:hypothetical protein